MDMFIMDLSRCTQPKTLFLGRGEMLPPTALGQIARYNSSWVNLSVHMLQQGGSLRCKNCVRLSIPPTNVIQITHFF